jgi:hypothetical protein
LAAAVLLLLVSDELGLASEVEELFELELSDEPSLFLLSEFSRARLRVP